MRILPAEWNVPWLSTANIMLPNATKHLAVFTTKKGIKGERQATVSSWSPLLALKYCSDVLLCGLLGSKGSWLGWGGEGSGSLAITMALSRFPSVFHSDKNEPQGLLLRSVRVTWPVTNWRHKRGNAMNWWEKKKRALAMLADNLTPGLAFPRQSLCYICPTLLLQSLSERAKCASSSQKGKVPQDQKAQDEREGSQHWAPYPFRQEASNKVLLTRNTQTANRWQDATGTPHTNTKCYRKDDSHTTVSLRGAWSTGLLGGPPKLAILPNCPIPFHI